MEVYLVVLDEVVDEFIIAFLGSKMKGVFATFYLSKQYITTHLTLPLVTQLIVPMMGHVNKTVMQEKEQHIKTRHNDYLKQLREKETTIEQLKQESKTKEQQLAQNQQTITELKQQLQQKEEAEEKENGPLSQQIKASGLIKLKDNKIPLLNAAQKGYNELINYLINHYKIDLKAVDNYGKNALHCAAERGQNSTTELLLDQYQMDLHAVDNHGQTAFYWSKEEGHDTTVQLLKSKELTQKVIKASDSSSYSFYGFSLGFLKK